MKSSAALFLLLGIILIGVGIRSYELTARSLWFDEAFSWRLVNFPFSEMIARDAADVHPPLYYVVLKGWGTVFGTSLLSLRSFSVVFAALTIAAAYLFGTSGWHSRRHGLIAALLIAVSGWQIAFAWEARMYTLGTFLALVSTWLLLRAVRESQDKHTALPAVVSWWVVYAIAAAAFTYTHYFAFFTLGAHGLFVLGYVLVQTRGRIGEIFQARMFWLALLGAVVAVGLYSPWIPTFLKQNAQVQESYWIPPIGGWSIPDTFYRMYAPTSGIPPRTVPGIILGVLPITFTIAVWIALVLSCRSRTLPNFKTTTSSPCDAAWLTMLCGAVPFVMSIALSFIGQSLYQDRFLVFANLFILTAIAVLLANIRSDSLRRILVALVTLFLLGTFIRYWNELDIVNKPGSHAAARLLNQLHQAGEPVVVTSPFVFFAIDHYDKEEFEDKLNPKLYSETGELLHFAGGPILTSADIIGSERMRALPSSAIWLVETTGFGGQELATPVQWLRAERHTFPEVFGYQGEVILNKYVK